MPTGSIVKADGWRRYEAKTFVISILDSGGTNLSTHAMTFVVSRQAGLPGIIEKTTGGGGLTITGGSGTNQAHVTFDPFDYDDLPAGVYSGMLFDETDDTVIWPRAEDSGDMYLGEGWIEP